MIFIDFECFAYDWLCVAIDPKTKKEYVIINDKEQLEKLYQQYKMDVWVGFNIRGYDQWILKAILCGFNPKLVNDHIILEKKNGYSFSKEFNRIPLIIFDTIPNPPVGLKTLEGFMGVNIHETSVPFDIDRPLTQDEIESTVGYCRDDVLNTIKVFAARIEEFSSQLELVKMFNMDASNLGKTKAQLSAMILGAVKTPNRGDEFNFVIPDTLRVSKYKFVVDWFIECRDRALNNIKAGIDPDVIRDGFYKQKLDCEIAGVPHTFAWGGLHGAKLNYIDEGYFVNCDVASYYPSMMIRYKYHSRSIHNPAKFDEIYHSRLEYKHKKDKRAQPLKIVLNSTYGAMKDKFNALYDPLMANNVCVTGQLLLLDLIEHLEPYADIVQSNTDGILVKLRATNEDEADREFARVDDICREWETRTGMSLEFDEYERVIQRDVNTYLIVDYTGKYKSKGWDVKKLNDLDYDLPIINKAIINWFVKKIKPEVTIGKCDSLRDFQKIYKLSSKYNYVLHGATFDKKTGWNGDGERMTDKVFRVFASRDESDGALYKVKTKGDRGDVPEKFAGCPDHCFIDNGDVREKGIPEKLDKVWYVKEAWRRIERFTKSE